jgi:hypothetical protein|nr:MAG TPA: hypothetical protein [Caudoviricetes sp.]
MENINVTLNLKGQYVGKKFAKLMSRFRDYLEDYLIDGRENLGLFTAVDIMYFTELGFKPITLAEMIKNEVNGKFSKEELREALTDTGIIPKRFTTQIGKGFEYRTHTITNLPSFDVVLRIYKDAYTEEQVKLNPPEEIQIPYASLEMIEKIREDFFENPMEFLFGGYGQLDYIKYGGIDTALPYAAEELMDSHTAYTLFIYHALYDSTLIRKSRGNENYKTVRDYLIQLFRALAIKANKGFVSAAEEAEKQVGKNIFTIEDAMPKYELGILRLYRSIEGILLNSKLLTCPMVNDDIISTFSKTVVIFNNFVEEELNKDLEEILTVFKRMIENILHEEEEVRVLTDRLNKLLKEANE